MPTLARDTQPSGLRSINGQATVLLPLLKKQRAFCSLLTALLWWSAGWSGIFAFGWIALLPFFHSLQGLDSKSRWRQGYAAGWLCYALINWWIIPTVTRAAPVIGVPNVGGFFLGLLAVGLIASIHAVLAGLAAVAWSPEVPFFRRFPYLLPMGVAWLWAVLDSLRCETILAHGWGALAYTQWSDTALLQTAAWLGQHGLTAVCVWFAASLALWLRSAPLKKNATAWVLPVGVLVLLHIAGAWRLSTSNLRSDSLRVLIVQTRVSSLGKNFSVGGEAALEQAIRLTREGVTEGAAAGKFDLIVWPETTVFAGRLDPPSKTRPMYEATTARYLPAGASLEAAVVARLSQELGTPILFGANAMQPRSGPQAAGMRNTAMMIDPDGRVQWSAKNRLVPFGEKAPFGDEVPFLKNLAPQPEVIAAPEPQMLLLKQASGEQIKIGAVICFESCFPDPARTLAERGARALFVLTNDEWFTGTDSPGEHAAMSALRAVENGVPVAQSANGGYAVAVDPRGRFLENGKYNVAGAIEARLPIGP